MNVGDLFLKLQLKMDKASFAFADKALNRLYGGLVAFATYKLGNYLTSMVTHVVDLGGQISDLSNKTGIGTERLQELGYAAKLNGLSMESVAQASSKLSKSLKDMGAKGGDGAAAFKKAGIAIKDTDGKVRSADDVMMDIADHLQGLSEIERPAAAMTLLGKSGAGMVGMLKDGSEGMRKYAQEARDLGAVMTGDAISGLDDFGDDIDRAKIAIQGLKDDAVVELLPIMQEMIQSFLAWIKVNRKLLIHKISQAVHLLIKAFKLIAKVIDTAVRVAEYLVDNWQAVLVVIGSLVAALVLLKGGLIATALAWLAQWAAALAPAIAVGIVIAALVLLVQDFLTWLDGGESVIGKWIKPAAQVRKEYAGWVDGLIIVGQTLKYIGEVIVGAVLLPFRMLYDTSAGLVKMIVGFFSGDLVMFFEGIVETLLGPFKWLGEQIYLGFKAPIDWVVKKIMWAVNKLGDIKDFFTYGDGETNEEYEARVRKEAGVAGIDYDALPKLDYAEVARNINNPEALAAMNARNAAAWTPQAAPRTMPVVGAAAAAAARPPVAANQTNNVTVNAPPGVDAKQVADMVRGQLDAYGGDLARNIIGGT